MLLNSKIFKVTAHRLLIFCAVTFTKVTAQPNLVPNYSFEDTVICPPLGVSIISPLYINNWLSPTNATPDYYNTNCNPPIVLQYARSGLGFGGFFLYSIIQPNYREYVHVMLNDTLIAQKKYCIEYHVSLMDVSVYAISQIGCYFSNSALMQGNTTNIPITPQVLSPINQYFTDTISWTVIRDEYVAQGGEIYLTIGNFNDDSNTSSLMVNGGNNVFSYYYIDDVSVVECEEEPLSIPNVFTPNGDGINDLFEIKGLQKGDKVNIYNRWGTKVFYNINEHAYWDGYTTSGEPCSSGTYFYTIDLINGERKSGYVQLVK